MDLDAIRSYIALARDGSFTLAAKSLHLSQSSVSRHVQRLERELGVALVKRSSARAALTPEGARFLEYAEAALVSYDELLAAIRGGPANLEGDLNILASTTPGEYLVPDLAREFVARFPRVRPRVFIFDSGQVATEISDQPWDLGFTGAQIPRRHLVYQAVAEDEVVLAAPAKHPLAGRGEVAPSELNGQPLIEREGGSGTLLSVQKAIAEKGVALPCWQVTLSVNTTQAIVGAVERGLGLGFVSSLALAGRPGDRVVALRLAGLPIRRSLYLVYDRRRRLTPTAQAFAQFALAHAGRILG